MRFWAPRGATWPAWTLLATGRRFACVAGYAEYLIGPCTRLFRSIPAMPLAATDGRTLPCSIVCAGMSNWIRLPARPRQLLTGAGRHKMQVPHQFPTTRDNHAPHSCRDFSPPRTDDVVSLRVGAIPFPTVRL